MKIKLIVHEAQEGGYWGEVPAIPGCATQGETVEELMKNVQEAVEGCLSSRRDRDLRRRGGAEGPPPATIRGREV